MRPQSWRWGYLAAGVALRVALIGFSTYQDAHSRVQYTDVDYSVFNDAAREVVTGCPLSRTAGSPLYNAESDLFDVSEFADVHCARGIIPAIARFVMKYDPNRSEMGDSLFSKTVLLSYSLTWPLFHFLATLGDPYARETYRYTPLLAVMLSPGHLVPNAWIYAGKLLFAAADIGCALLMWRILDIRAMRYGNIYPAFMSNAVTHLPGILWLINPFPAQIATRGSSDSVIGFLVLAFLSLLLRATPETALVDDRDFRKQADVDEASKSATSDADKMQRYKPSDVSVVSEYAFDWAAILLALAVHFKLFPVVYGVSILMHLANYRRHALAVMCGISKPSFYDVHALGLQFACRAAVAYFAMDAVAWLIWGQPFIDNALLYHLWRRDHRHNFSVYFLQTYLGLDGAPEMSQAQSYLSLALNSPLSSFVPQLALLAGVGIMLGGLDLLLSCFIQTVVFVAWNKVYTSQYFLWYLWFVPIVGVTMRFRSHLQIALVTAVWVGTQALWLYHAFRLEFEGQDSFVALWLSSLALLAGQAWAAGTLVKAWSRWRIEQRAVRSKVTKHE